MVMKCAATGMGMHVDMTAYFLVSEMFFAANHSKYGTEETIPSTNKYTCTNEPTHNTK